MGLGSFRSVKNFGGQLTEFLWGTREGVSTSDGPQTFPAFEKSGLPCSIKMFFDSTPANWGLKRVFKFVLKRSLGPFLKTEVDLDQLDVHLGTGTLELRDVLLNCQYLNEQLVSFILTLYFFCLSPCREH